MRRFGPTALLAASLIAVPLEARAQSADQLYEDGLKAMLAEDYATGCPLLQKSYDMDPLPGALFTLAACYDRWGKVKSALERYRAFLAIKHDMTSMPADKRATLEERTKTAQDKVKELEPQVPTITVAAEGEVSIDGAPADAGTPVEVDPGEHAIVVVLPSGERLERSVSVSASQAETVSFEAPAPKPPAPQPDKPEPSSSRTPMLAGAGVAAGLGLAGVVVGAVTGGLVFAKKSDVEDQCVDNVCTPEGKEAVDEAQTLGLVSTIGFIAGGVGLAAGALLFFLAPDEEDEGDMAARIEIDTTGGMLTVKGSF